MERELAKTPTRMTLVDLPSKMSTRSHREHAEWRPGEHAE